MKRLLLLIGCIGMMLGGSRVSAAPAPSGLSVAPAIEQIVFDPGQAAAEFSTQVVDNTGTNMTVVVSAQDFVASGQNGGIRFLDPGSGGGHSLVSAITIGQEVVSIAAGQSAAVPVTVANISNLAPGGHYAAIVYRVVHAGALSGNTVSVTPAVSTLVFASTTGNGTQAIQLAPPAISAVQAALPTELNMVFGNTGNTQTTLRGIVQLTGADKQLISQGVINIDSGLILPGSTRLFSVDLGAPASGLRWPGFYYVRVAYRHNGQSDYSVYQKRFLFIGIPFVVGVIAVLVIVGLMLRRLVLRRIYRPRHQR